MRIVVCHAAWLPERKATLARLLKQLPDSNPVDGRVIVFESSRREPAIVWARRAWEYVADQEGPCVILNDDVTVCPDFERVVAAIAEAAPHRAVSLHTSAPGAEKLRGDTSWCRVYWYTGPGVMLWPEHARALLDFWAELPAGFGPNEDNVAIQWAWGRQEPFWSTIPAVVRHDTETKSSLGYDHHELRSSNVDWEYGPKDGAWGWGPGVDPPDPKKLTTVDYWKRGVEDPPFLENPWAKADALERTRRALATVEPCRICWQRQALIRNGLVPTCVDCAARAVLAIQPRYKLFAATPYRADGVMPEHMASMLALQKMVGLELAHEMSLGARHEHDDLVRVRSRMVRIADQGDYTHMLLGDGDNSWDPRVVVGMLRTGKDFVQCPYLRRDGRGYTIRPTEKDRKAGRTAPEDIQSDNTIEIEHTGLGLTLLSRECIAKMTSHYRILDGRRVSIDPAIEHGKVGLSRLGRGAIEDLVLDMAYELREWRAGHMGLCYTDLDRDAMTTHETVGLFQLMVRDGVLLSEDASFATRWRDIGGKVWLYIGPGTPIAHHGTKTYQGDIEDLGFSHGKAATGT